MIEPYPGYQWTTAWWMMLIDDWHAVALSDEVTDKAPVGVSLLERRRRSAELSLPQLDLDRSGHCVASRPIRIRNRLRSDKTSIAYRRWLNDLGLTFGTS